MSTDAEIKLNNGCTPKNALFCCHSPVCLNSSPKILPIDGQDYNRSVADVVPVRIPDLTKIGMLDVNQLSKHSEPEPAIPNNDHKSVPAATMAVPQQETRLGVVLRRTSPQKKSIVVKKSDPMMGVVLRKVEKQSLLPPKLRITERSPPPKKLPAKPKKTLPAPPPEPMKPEVIPVPPPKPPKPINLLKNRPPPEIYKIEGDKIIIIKRIPRAQPPPGTDATKTTTADAKGSHRHHKGHHGKNRHPKGPIKTIQIQVTSYLCAGKVLYVTLDSISNSYVMCFPIAHSFIVANYLTNNTFFFFYYYLFLYTTCLLWHAFKPVLSL